MTADHGTQTAPHPDARYPYIAVVAHAENRAIGLADLSMPWRLPNDLRRLRALTLEHAVVMGRVTFETLPVPLSKRTNIVLTRSDSFPGMDHDLVRIAHTPEDLDTIHADTPYAAKPLIVLGGAEVYELLMPKVGVIERTLVHTTPDNATAFFPDVGDDFALAWEEHHDADDRHSAPFTFQRLERVSG